jgi:opine dehydrogenase
MRLAVLGSMPLAAVNSAWAAAKSGEVVTYVTDTHPAGIWSMEVRCQGVALPARVERVGVGDPIVADAFLLIASREESIELVRAYAQAMSGRPILLAPGGFALVEAIADMINPVATHPSALGQLPGFPVAGDIEADGVRIRSIKRQFPVGPLHKEDSSHLLDIFRIWFPDLVESSLEETTLSNINNVIHPPVLLVNAGRTERADGYVFYRDGMSAGASRLIDRIDEERLALLKALDQEAVPITGWIERYYGDQGLTGATIGEMLNTLPALAKGQGPQTLNHRFVSEDICYGLAPMEALANRIGVETPYLSSMITTFSAICGSNLRAHAPELAQNTAFSPKN